MRIQIISLYILFSIFPLFCQQNIEKKIKSEIDSLMITGDYSYTIKSISDPIDDIYVVSLEPPYREFPNIILFKFNHLDNSITRVYEALSLGIQDKRSHLLDLHTIGIAMDLIIDDGAQIKIDERTKSIIKMFENQCGTIVLYEKFLHGHYRQRKDYHYLIDKTQYTKLAIKLFGDIYTNYPDKACIMYDTPNLENVKFYRNHNKYFIEAQTSNNQKWVAMFAGIDVSNKFLIDKVIIAEKLK